MPKTFGKSARQGIGDDFNLQLILQPQFLPFAAGGISVVAVIADERFIMTGDMETNPMEKLDGIQNLEVPFLPLMQPGLHFLHIPDFICRSPKHYKIVLVFIEDFKSQVLVKFNRQCIAPVNAERDSSVMFLCGLENSSHKLSPNTLSAVFRADSDRQLRRFTLKTRLGKLTVDIPQVRGDVEFYPSALEKGIRSERALKLAIAEMYVKGVSTRKVTRVLEKMCGLEITSSQVSRASKELDDELSKWRSRPLGEYAYLILDARYEKVRQGGSLLSSAVMTAVGVNEDGRRSVLGCGCSMSEAKTHWKEFLSSIRDRGLSGVRYVVSDDHTGLRAALEEVFSGVTLQRCQCHLQRNAFAYIPRVKWRAEVAADIRDIWNAPDREEAEVRLKKYVLKWREKAPKLADWMEENLPEGLAVFELPEKHRRRLRTTNMLEVVNREIKRRTRVARLFPNEESLIRLVSAILMEISEEWETGRVYLDMIPENENSNTDSSQIYRKNVA